MTLEHWWSDTDEGNSHTEGNACPTTAVCISRLITARSGLKPGLRVEKPATNYLSYATAATRIKIQLAYKDLFLRLREHNVRLLERQTD